MPKLCDVPCGQRVRLSCRCEAEMYEEAPYGAAEHNAIQKGMPVAELAQPWVKLISSERCAAHRNLVYVPYDGSAQVEVI